MQELAHLCPEVRPASSHDPAPGREAVEARVRLRAGQHLDLQVEKVDLGELAAAVAEEYNVATGPARVRVDTPDDMVAVRGDLAALRIESDGLDDRGAGIYAAQYVAHHASSMPCEIAMPLESSTTSSGEYVKMSVKGPIDLAAVQKSLFYVS